MSSRKKNNSSNRIDRDSDSYAQGYWDGYKVRKEEEKTGEFENEVYLLEQTGSLNFIAADNETKELSEAEISDMHEKMVDDYEATKVKHQLQNINTTLYVASFLLVAAVALFIGTSLPGEVRFMGVCVVAALFYVTGLYLHDHIEKLKPAGVAFTGTGLAILPFAGIAMYNFALPNAPVCWFITSVIGVLAFAYAAISLKSQVVAYLAIAFMISTSTSSMATLGVGLIWYYVVLIIFGSFITLISTINPRWLPSAFSSPVQNSSQWIVPLTLGVSLLSFTSLSVTDYWVITLTSAIYYASVAASSVALRDVALLIARILASLTAILISFDVSQSWIMVGIVTSIVGVAQIAISSLINRSVERFDSNTACLWIGFSMQLIAPLFVMSDSSWGVVVAIQLTVLTLISLVSSSYLKKPELSSFGVFSLAVLPIVVGYKVISPAFDNNSVGIIFAMMSLMSFAIIAINKSKKSTNIIQQILLITTSLFAFEALLFTSGSSSGWRAMVWLAISLIIYYLVYINRRSWLFIASNVVLIGAILSALEFIGVSASWYWTIMSLIAMVLFYAIYYVLYKSNREDYGMSFWWSAVVTGILVNVCGLIGFGVNQDSVSLVSVSSFALIAVAGAIVVKGYKDKIYGYIDLGVIIGTVAMQRLLGINVSNLNFLVYTHWWALVVAGLACFYHSIGREQSFKTRAVIALSFVSIFTGIMAITASFGDGIPYKLIFLVEHIAIIIAGLGLSRKMYTIWGAVGVTFAILWMLSGMTYVLLAMLAFGLIGFAVYALTKQSK